MGQALYRKYRSKSLAEIVGQEHITTTLKNALAAGKISHAYLLTGPRGVGKTSIARILAHEINGLTYGDEAHLDIIEIDAASNRRIDEIRDLRERVSTAPSAAAYKVYIIDEVHMLTKEAFNALLKTLEEPPAHVIFILATTEAHKLPETIISRTQRFSFRPVPAKQVIAHLKFIANAEKISIDEASLALIAEHGEGSFRDSISLLDQVSNVADKVTIASVEAMLGLAPSSFITSLHHSLASSDIAGIVSTLEELGQLGYEPAMIATQLSKQLRSDVISGKSVEYTLPLLGRLLDVAGSRNPKQILEIILLEQVIIAKPMTTTINTPVAVAANTPTIVSPPVPEKVGAIASQPPIITPTPTHEMVEPVHSAPMPVTEQTASKQNLADPIPKDDAELWQQLLEHIKRQYNTLYGILRMASPSFDGDKLTLRFGFAFHQKRINEPKNKTIIGDLLQSINGKSYQIQCLVEKTDQPGTLQPAAKQAASTDAVSAISNIFGGVELLES